MKNQGKRFEENFKKSLVIDDDILYYRFRDNTSSWEKGSMTRFQQTNISDCMIFNGEKLFFIELKSHKGKSIPTSCIRDNQLKDMLAFSLKKNVKCLLIINFSDVGRCFALDIEDYEAFLEVEERKSIPISYLESHGIEIEVKKLNVNYRYGINDLLNIYTNEK